MKPSVLFISYYYDPYILAGTRNYYLSNMLAAQGYELHVISRENPHIDSFIKSKSIQFYPVKRWDYRRIFKLLGFRDGITSSLIKSQQFIRWGHRLALTYPFNYLLGEGGWFYHVQAIKMAADLIQRKKIKIIYSSFMPLNDHLIAGKLKAMNKELYWIGDFRDLIWWQTDNRNYQKKWIRNMIHSMDAMTAGTMGIGSFYKNVYHRDIVTVYNGLPNEKATIQTSGYLENKFRINYSGRIFVEFIKNNSFFESLNELIHENLEFKQDLIVVYSGVNKNWFKEKIVHFGLGLNTLLKDQINTKDAWNDMVNASINLIFTWTTNEIQGFIHGKFNECVLIGNPLLCLIDGEMDLELQDIYSSIPNSIVLGNNTNSKIEIKNYILDIYSTWKQVNGNPNYSINEHVRKLYSWEVKAKPFIQIIENVPVI